MRRLFSLLLLLSFMSAANAFACVDCIMRQCTDDGPHTVCDNIQGHGCIASGVCPPSQIGCLGSRLNVQIASVSITRPPADNAFLVAHAGGVAVSPGFISSARKTLLMR